MKEKILKILKKNKDGLTISDLARKLKSTRPTIGKYVCILELEKKIEIKKVGPAKLVRLRR
ncbi:MAG: HTH domain-containing protein [Candidatus Heimdallarchaeaceae archaeon]